MSTPAYAEEQIEIMCATREPPRDWSYEPLTPATFLTRAAYVFGDRTALNDGCVRWGYGELWERVRRLAGPLSGMGAGDGGRVAVLARNSPLLLEAHYGVPLAGAVLVALNSRLSAAELAYILDHCGARFLLCDTDLLLLARAAASKAHRTPEVLATDEYERRIEHADPLVRGVTDERELVSINYTSGTTGRPKGVVYHHRGAFLQALAMVAHAQLRADSVFLWTLPMFHWNGWCFTWAVTAAGARHVCLPRLDPGAVWQLIDEAGITHFNAAPTVLIDLANNAAAHPVARTIRVCTGGAPPSPTLLGRLAEIGIEVTHLYGMTETFGPAMVCDWHPEWDAFPAARQARLKARQGVGSIISQQARVVAADGTEVPADRETLGELVLRGNNVMLGYYRDQEATAAAMLDGWLRTGDLGVMHPDGYLELRDRLKDVIISGEENIASVEVEQVIATHPAVPEVAVIGRPDTRWGERPAAFVRLRPGHRAFEGEIIEHVRGRLAAFKCPREVVFCDDLPRTATGRIQKFRLRKQSKESTA